MSDPDFNPVAQLGEIRSKINLELDKAVQIVTEQEAQKELARRNERKVHMRGVFELAEQSHSFIASIQDVPSVEISGITVPPRPNSQLQGVGKSKGEAIKALGLEVEKREAVG